MNVSTKSQASNPYKADTLQTIRQSVKDLREGIATFLDEQTAKASANLRSACNDFDNTVKLAHLDSFIPEDETERAELDAMVELGSHSACYACDLLEKTAPSPFLIGMPGGKQ